MTLNEKIATVLLSTLLSVVVNVVLYVWARADNQRKDAVARVQDRIDRLLQFAIERPYLEDDGYAEKWPERLADDDDSMRYDNYCCFLFNLVEFLYLHSGGKAKRMQEQLYYREIIFRHRHWWRSQKENNLGYNRKFRKHVDDEISACEEMVARE